MTSKDGFDPDLRLPRFLTDETEQQVTGKVWDTNVLSSRVLKASIWAATATAIGIALLSLGNPRTFIADVTASLLDKSALQPDTEKLIPEMQPIADAQALPLSAKHAPTRDESYQADQSHRENSEPASDTLGRKFQAWAADKDAQVRPVEHVQDGRAQDSETTQFKQFGGWAAEQDVQAKEDVPARVTENVQFREFEAWAAEKDAQAQVGSLLSVHDAKALVVQEAPAHVAQNAQARRPLQQHQHAQPVQNARAEIRRVRNSRRNVPRQQNARVQVPHAQDARAQK